MVVDGSTVNLGLWDTAGKFNFLVTSHSSCILGVSCVIVDIFELWYRPRRLQ